jgi:hypothetical protein
MKFAAAALASLALLFSSCDAFAPASFAVINNSVKQTVFSASTAAPAFESTRLNMMDPAQITTDATNFLSTFGTDNLLSFSDQGQNLAGIFFQASLLPYLAFLYFLSFRGNRVPELGNFGFQFLLLFVLSTIPSGIVTKGVYGISLADCDWLHGGAEGLLTLTNVLVVLGFRQAMSVPVEERYTSWKIKAAAAGGVAAFAAALATGTGLGFESHSAFLFGLGNLPGEFVESLPWVLHSEPVNALSIPTWAIHFSSVFEWLFAMNLVWNFSENTGNEKWKG